MRLRNTITSTACSILLLSSLGAVTSNGIAKAHHQRHSGNIEWRQNRRNSKSRVYKDTIIPARVSNQNRLIFQRNEKIPLILWVDRSIQASDNQSVAIPRGSWISGRLKPHDGGTRFEAERLFFRDGNDFKIKARSAVLYPNRRIRRVSSRGTFLSKATKVLIGSITGTTNTSSWPDEFGARPRRNDDYWTRNQRNLIMIYPNENLDLRLRSDLKIRY